MNSTYVMENNYVKPIIYYIQDPLCSWCYGFQPVLNELYQSFKDKLEFKVLSGGLFQNQKSSASADFRSYMDNNYTDVVKSTGIKFGIGFTQHTFRSSSAEFISDYPSLAITVFKSFDTPFNLRYTLDVQNAIFFEGIEPNDVKHFAYLALSYGVNTSEFVSRYESSDFLHHTYEEYFLTAKLGVTKFPSLLIQHNEKLQTLNSGFTSLQELYSKISEILPWPEFSPSKASKEVMPPQGA